MKRLLLKECRENRSYLWGMLALVAVFILIGDPLAFRSGGNVQDFLPELLSVPSLLVVFAGFLMGLSAYSRELAGGSLSFALSRPVRWSWLLVAKLIAGSGVCLLVALAASVLYVVRVPQLYRPFLDLMTLAMGASFLFWIALIGYLFGFAFSTLVPGVALSFAVAVGIVSLFLTAADGLERLYPHTEAFLYAGLAFALLASIRSPTILQPRRRIGSWVAGFAAGIVLVAAYGLGQRALGGQQGPVATQPPASNWMASPDGEMVFYWSHTYGGPAPGDVWVRDSRGSLHHVDTAKRANFIAWSEDGSTIYYAAGPNDRVELRSASGRDNWRPHTITVLPPPAENAPDSRAYIETYMDRPEEEKWSPDGDRLALNFGVYLTPSTRTDSLVAVDVATGRAARIYEGSYTGNWWVDNDHVGVLTDGARIIVRRFPEPRTP